MTGGRSGLALGLGIVFILLVSGCTESGTSGGIYHKIDPFNMSLSFSEHPRFNETTDLVITIRPHDDVSSVRAFIMASKGIELMGEYKLEYGTAWLNWNTTVNKSEEFHYNLPIKLIEVGDYSMGVQLEGMIRERDTNKFVITDNFPTSIYFHVTPQEVIISNAPLYYGPRCTGTLEQVQQCMKTEAKET